MIFSNHKLPEVYLKVILSLFLRFISFILEIPTPIIFVRNYGEFSVGFTGNAQSFLLERMNACLTKCKYLLFSLISVSFIGKRNRPDLT